MKITLEMLRAKGACADQVKLFQALFGEGVTPTLALCVLHAQVFCWGWASCLLSAEAKEACDKTYISVKEAYDRSCAEADKVFEKASAEARETYFKTRAAAWEAHNKTRDEAWEARNKTRAKAWFAAWESQERVEP